MKHSPREASRLLLHQRLQHIFRRRGRCQSHCLSLTLRRSHGIPQRLIHTDGQHERWLADGLAAIFVYHRGVGVDLAQPAVDQSEYAKRYWQTVLSWSMILEELRLSSRTRSGIHSRTPSHGLRVPGSSPGQALPAMTNSDGKAAQSVYLFFGALFYYSPNESETT